MASLNERKEIPIQSVGASDSDALYRYCYRKASEESLAVFVKLQPKQRKPCG